MVNDFARRIFEECKKLGTPGAIIEVRLSLKEQARMKQIEEDAMDYVMKIEKAHKRARHSKLLFKTQVG